MNSENQRRHERIKHQANIRVSPDEEVVYTLEMRDFSEPGFIYSVMIQA